MKEPITSYVGLDIHKDSVAIAIAQAGRGAPQFAKKRKCVVGFAMPVRLPHHPLGYAKRFDRSRKLLPVAGLTHALGRDDVAASLQPHYRAFLTTTSDSSTDLCLGILPHGFRPLVISLHITASDFPRSP